MAKRPKRFERTIEYIDMYVYLHVDTYNAVVFEEFPVLLCNGVVQSLNVYSMPVINDENLCSLTDGSKVS